MKNRTLLLKTRILSRDRCSHGPVGRRIKLANRPRPATGRWLQGHNVLFFITLLCAAMASVQIVHAATITVTSTNDSGVGSLRQALVDANDGDTIDFSVTGTITLTSAELVVNKNNLTISGPGPNQLIVQRSTAVGTPAFRVFHISSGKTVTISGLTITKGYASGNGGGIYNDHATLTVSDCTISGNAGPYGGGGIYNFGEFGDATL